MSDQAVVDQAVKTLEESMEKLVKIEDNSGNNAEEIMGTKTAEIKARTEETTVRAAVIITRMEGARITATAAREAAINRCSRLPEPILLL